MTEDQALGTAIEEGDLDTLLSSIETKEDFDRIVAMVGKIIGPGCKLEVMLCNELPEFAELDEEDEEEED